MLGIRRCRFQHIVACLICMAVIANVRFLNIQTTTGRRAHQIDSLTKSDFDWPNELDDSDLNLHVAETNIKGEINSDLDWPDFRKSESMKWWKQATHSQLQHEYVNMHKYAFIMNNESLCNGDVLLVICIPIDPEKAEQRNLIRQTWASLTTTAGRRIVHVFLIGRRWYDNSAKMIQLQERLLKENSLHHDIIQGDFYDSYRNLTYKSIMCFHWVKTFCPRASFLLKADDDLMVNMYALIAFLKNNEDFLKLRNVMLCFKVWPFPPPYRDRDSKWYVTREEYPLTYYPAYCNGLANIFTQPTVRNLYAASSKVPFFWIEDIYTGYCAQVYNTRLIEVGSWLPYWNTTTFTDLQEEEYDWLALWEQITTERDYGKKF